MKAAVAQAKLGNDDRLDALRRLDEQARMLEHHATGPSLPAFIAEEFSDGFHGLALDAAAKHRFIAAAVAARLVRAFRASGCGVGAGRAGAH